MPLAFPLSLSLPCSWQCWQGPQKVTTVVQALCNEAKKTLVGADKQLKIARRSKEIVLLRSVLNYHASSVDELLWSIPSVTQIRYEEDIEQGMTRVQISVGLCF